MHKRHIDILNSVTHIYTPLCLLCYIANRQFNDAALKCRMEGQSTYVAAYFSRAFKLLF